MSQGLKPCPTCGNPYPDIESGDMVRCDQCGESAFFDNWQKSRADLPWGAKPITCEHGVDDGEFCEECNDEMKEARRRNAR